MMLSTIMYHYVRPIAGSRWSRIRGLELDDFRSQLRYLKSNYNIVSLPEVIAALDGAELPSNACLLTFDDGYADHYQHVFPLLHDAGVSGTFFPIGMSLAARAVPVVNKIHFILASQPSARCLLPEVLPHRDLRMPAPSNRWDDEATALVKAILQWNGGQLVDGLFAKYVTADETAFADELYLSTEQAKVMAANGMHFGVHGWSHSRFSRMREDMQAADIELSAGCLRARGLLPERWAMCYPYGSPRDFDDTTVRLLAERGCAAAFTTSSSASFPGMDRMYIPRLDTNDVPRA